MPTVAQLKVLFTHNLAQVQAEMGAFGAMLGKAGPVGIGAGVAIALVAGIGAVATKMAGDFEAATTTLVTGAGESATALDGVRAAILKMSTDTGTSTKQLVDGMYMIDSAGFTAAKGGLTVLQAAAEGAKVGNADLGTVANAVTTILTDYGLKANQADMATNALVATVARGKTHMEDLAGSLSHVLPAAQNLHISLGDVMGAMATMTGEGIDAANAATYLRQMMLSLSAPNSAATKSLKDIGLTADDLSAKLHQGLPAALALIQSHLAATYKDGSPQYVEAEKNISGGLREMQGYLALTGGHLATFGDNVKAITGQVKAGGDSVVGWNMVQGTFNQKMDQAKSAASVLMIELGQKLLPVATQFIGYVAGTAIPAITKFVSWITGSSDSAERFRPILAAVAIAIGGALVAAFVAWAISAAAAAFATIAATWPILAIGAAIALLIAGVILLVTHWKQISTAFADSGFGKAVLGAIKAIKDAVGDLLGKLGALKDAVGNALGGVGKALGSVHIPGFAAGGTLPQGWAMVGEQGPELIRAPGAQVIPLPSATTAAGGGGAPSAGGGQMVQVTTQINLDGRQVAQVVTRHLPGVVRQATGQRGY